MRIPVIRWGKEYESLETTEIVHFATGEIIATVDQAVGGLVTRDMRSANQARKTLREFSCDQILDKLVTAADHFENDALPLGDSVQSVDDFVRQQSASTGLPEVMCRANIKKNSFVMRNMRDILSALTRRLDLEILSRGYGREQREVTISYQAQTPVLSAVLPSNSPGVHTLWLPAIALQMGLALKPGSQEPWTAYRVASAMAAAGIPQSVISLYPGGHDVGSALVNASRRTMIFGSEKTVNQYAGNPGVQVHGPGFSKILLGEDCVDDWPDFLDLMIESVYSNGGRSCINASSIWAPRHAKEIAEAIAQRLGPIDVKSPDDPDCGLAAFTVAGAGRAIWELIEQELAAPGVAHLTENFGARLVDQDRYSYLRPTVALAKPECSIVGKEFMFPFVTVVECAQADMLRQIGPTLVATAITDNESWRDELVNSTQIDRLNLGPIPTNRLNWLQPHEGNIIDFLFRSRALQL